MFSLRKKKPSDFSSYFFFLFSFIQLLFVLILPINKRKDKQYSDWFPFAVPPFFFLFSEKENVKEDHHFRNKSSLLILLQLIAKNQGEESTKYNITRIKKKNTGEHICIKMYTIDILKISFYLCRYKRHTAYVRDDTKCHITFFMVPIYFIIYVCVCVCLYIYRGRSVQCSVTHKYLEIHICIYLWFYDILIFFRNDTFHYYLWNWALVSIFL